MSDEKLEALKLTQAGDTAMVYDGRGTYCVVHCAQSYGARDIVKHVNRNIDAAHALGVEDGTREAGDALHAKGIYCTRIENELEEARRANKRLREAAPVDDGRRFQIVWPGEDRLVQRYAHETFSETCADAICQAQDGDGILVYATRPVEPKHVHAWSTARLDGTRICLDAACHQRQVAEWKDEPSR